jgi:2-methylcitrate dehydratase PrpD
MDDLSKIIDHVTNIRFDDLPAEVVDTTKRFVMDSVGVAIAGAKAPGCPEVVDLLKGWGGKPESTIMSYGGKVPAPMAALANSMMMHALDFDDTLDESALHANVSVLPAALAMAEAAGRVSGKDFITATVLGTDMVCRLGLSTKRPLSWIRTATCGSFGAAVAAGRLMGLNRAGMGRALGIVYSQTSGNAQCLVDGGLVKRMQPAFSAKAGVLSAFLAEKGITGAKDPFEGEYGFFNLYEQGDYDREKLLNGFGERFEGMRLSIKPYPSCRMTHASIDGALAALKEHRFNPHDVKEVVVHVSQMAENMVGKPFQIRENPQVDAQFSIPYTVATAFVKGDVRLEDFEESSIRDAKVLGVAKVVRVVADPALPARDMSTARLSIRCLDKVYETRVENMKGSPANPMNVKECIDKFRKCVAYGGNKGIQERADSIVEQLITLESLKDMAGLMNLLGG